jgi:DNA processing protein
MEGYVNSEEDIIIADSFSEISYKQKKLFLASLGEKNIDRQKYAQMLIKTAGSGVYNKLKENFCDQKYRALILQKLKERGLVCITVKSKNYPEYLKQTAVPPLVLYCKGDTKLLSGSCFAVVGSRRTLAATLALGRQISQELAKKFVIVTGVADGADSAAIEGGLCGGKVICVIANGIDFIYAATNYSLIKKVEERGLIISEYPPEVPPQRFNFSMRNRIIAGLCRGTLVLSAAKKSGALITANYALEYNRDVFALPYSVGVSSGEGCNALIKNGASLTEGAEDIFSAYGISCEEKQAENLTEEEKAILEIIKQNGEIHLEKLAAQMDKKSFQVVPICSALEIKGFIVKAGGNKYSAVR